MSCGWGVKAGMVHVEVAGHMLQAISEHFRDKWLRPIYEVGM